MSLFRTIITQNAMRSSVPDVVEPELNALKFTGTETFTLSADYHIWDGTVEYSLDGSTWTTWSEDETIGGTTELYLRGTGNTRFATDTSTDSYTRFVFNTTGTISASGRIDSLLDWKTVGLGGTPEMADYAFAYMFYGCTSLVSAPELPATTLASDCYRSMFNGCTSLVSAPELPATTLASDCYRYMFRGCTRLTTAPELPATTLATYCYYFMFYDCTSLTTAPELPATTLATFCYAYMFRGCTSLTTAPELPATTLAIGCYYFMFYDCTSLKVSSSYNASSYNYTWSIPSSGIIRSEATNWNISMLMGTGGDFTDDPSINTIYYLDIGEVVELEPNALKFEGSTDFTMSYSAKNWNGIVEYSTDNETWTEWTSGSTPSSTILYLRGTGNTRFATSTTAYTTFSFNTTGTISASGRIDSLLDYQTVADGGTPEMGDYAYLYMFKGCTQLITAPELPATTLTAYCYCQLFYGCTSLTAAPDLPATTTATYCYAAMFHSCTSLTTAPTTLPADTVINYGYQYMFYGCTSLITAPDLPATTITTYCYRYMFRGCTSLVNVPTTLPATTAKQYCYQYMFYDCSSLVIPPTLPATTLANYCYGYMFYNCSSVKLSTTQVDNYTYEWSIPSSGTIGSTATSWGQLMFTGTGGTKTGAGAINTTYYLDVS